jgi:predicted DNA-binding helix-hairpin-helix protein
MGMCFVWVYDGRFFAVAKVLMAKKELCRLFLSRRIHHSPRHHITFKGLAWQHLNRPRRHVYSATFLDVEKLEVIRYSG